MMGFTVRGLLSYIVLASVSLALTQAPFVIGCGLLVFAIIVTNFVLPSQVWRFLAYGALLGIVIAVVGLLVYTNLIVTGPRTYTDGRIDAIFATRTYLVQLGAFVGATSGFLLSKRNSPTAI